MSYFGDRPKGFFEWWDAIDLWVYGIVAGIAVLLAPILVGLHLLGNGKVGAAGVVLAVWFGSIVACIRDIRRKKWSWISTIVCGLWVVAMFALSAAW